MQWIWVAANYLLGQPFLDRSLCHPPHSQPQDMHTVTRNIHLQIEAFFAVSFFEISNTKQSSPQFLTGYNCHFLSLPPGFSPMRKYGGGISGKKRNTELAQDLMKVAETKCSTT